MADTPLQTKTYNTDTAAVSHDITLDSFTAARSTIVIAVSYEGAVGNKVTSIVDTDSGTWNADANLKQSNSVSVNGEGQYRYNLVGGTKPTITVNLASALKCQIVVAEYKGILSYANPLDKTVGRINTPAAASQFRSSGATATRTAPVEVIIELMMWNTAAITTLANGTGFTTDAYVRNTTNNIGVAIGHRTSEVASMAGSSANASFRFTDAGNTAPAAVMCMAFFREGVFPVPDTTKDGIIDNIEGVVTVDTSFCLVFKSSATAPTSGATGSTRTNSYFIMPFSTYGAIPAGVTATNPSFNYTANVGYDDPLSYAEFQLHTDKTDILGTDITADDEEKPTTNHRSLGVEPTVVGFHSVALDDSEIDLSTSLSARMSVEPTESTSSYADIYDYNSLQPAFCRVTLVWPSLDTPQMNMSGVGT